MQRKALKGGRLLEGGYDEAGRVLEIVFDDLSVRRFTAVPFEVWQRLQAAPNAAVYYEDRIKDEYPWSTAPKLAARPGSKPGLADLFGEPAGKASEQPADSHRSDQQKDQATDPAAAAKARLAALFGKPD